MFKVLKDPENNFLSGFSKADYASMRSLMISMVLATDGAVHFNELAIFKTTVLGPLEEKSEKKADFRTNLLRMALHGKGVAWEMAERRDR